MEPRLAVNNDFGPGPPIGNKDWITPLPVGTRFLCMDNKTKNILELEVLARSPGDYVKLIDHGDSSVCWHIPEAFCFQKTFADILED
jgi:hypothetical protein